MNFYGIEYLKSQSNLNDYLKYFFIFALLIGLVIVVKSIILCKILYNVLPVSH